MKRVTGIGGGIFFNSPDPAALRAWYKEHLGIDVQDWGGTAFTWTDSEGKPTAGSTIWTIGDATSNYFAPSTAPIVLPRNSLTFSQILFCVNIIFSLHLIFDLK